MCMPERRKPGMHEVDHDMHMGQTICGCMSTPGMLNQGPCSACVSHQRCKSPPSTGSPTAAAPPMSQSGPQRLVTGQQGAPSLPGTDSLPQRHGCHNKNTVIDPQASVGPFVMTLLYLFGAAVMGSQECNRPAVPGHKTQGVGRARQPPRRWWPARRPPGPASELWYPPRGRSGSG